MHHVIENSGGAGAKPEILNFYDKCHVLFSRVAMGLGAGFNQSSFPPAYFSPIFTDDRSSGPHQAVCRTHCGGSCVFQRSAWRNRRVSWAKWGW
jgi:hypothetical protein